MKRLLALPLLLATLTPAFAQEQPGQVREQLARVDAEIASGSYKADWNSLGAFRVPEWFRDAKFGIFIHWGPYAVPAFGSEWYSRNLYVPDSKENRHHIQTYGPLTQFGYKDFIPQFKAERFDAEDWVTLFEKAGAKYVVPVAEHCDGFAMYDSQFTKWNAAKMGPKRDVVAELAKATRAHGLHLGLSSHRAEHWWWYAGGMQAPSDVQDARYSGLYGPAKPMALPGAKSTKEPDPNHLEDWLPPDTAFLNDWLARSTELVDKYHPEYLYFDWWIGQPAFRPYLKRMAAYYYDKGADRKQHVLLSYKDHDYPENAALLELERGRLDALRLLPWQTDTSVSIKSWGYIENDEYRDAKSLIQQLADIVSKNGNLLLNIGPRADGTLPEPVRATLLDMGRWLSANGEAIYGTRPCALYGEGPTHTVEGQRKDHTTSAFTAEDFRFTCKGSTLYAIAFALPENRQLHIRTLYRGTPYLAGQIRKIELLGSSAPVEWKAAEDGLYLQLPEQKPNDIAWVFRITTN